MRALYTFENVPKEMVELKRWVVWKLEDSEKRPRCKAPYQASNLQWGAASTKPEHWASFDDAIAAWPKLVPTEKYKNENCTGIGFVITDGYLGVDFDHCFNEATGVTDAWADEVRAALPETYTELSVSRAGFHLLYKLAEGVQLQKKIFENIEIEGNKKLECYSDDRYFVTTGWVSKGERRPVHRLTADELKELLTVIRGEKRSKNTTKNAPRISSEKLQEYMTRHDFEDLSAAVHSLVTRLMHDYNLDREQVDAKFRESALFNKTHWKKKWERLGKQEMDKVEPMAKDWIERDLKKANRQTGGEGIDGFPLTDTGNAERLIKHHGEDLCYAPAAKSFFVWNGKHWDREFSQALVFDRALRVVRQLKDQAHEVDDKAMNKWAWESESRSRLDNMISIAKHLSKQVKHDDFNVSPWLLTCNNGTLDLNTFEFRESQRSDLNSKIISFDYDPEASCGLWQQFIERILPSAGVRGFVQRSLGYSLTGLTRENLLWLLIGESGANGKTTFIETLRHVFGDYARTMDFNSLLPHDKRGPSGDIARLQGARFVSACESEQNQRLSPKMVKQLTGGDMIQASFKFQDEFEFKPTHKIWMATNFAPKLPVEDKGLWRRVVRIPFEVQIPFPERDKELGEKLRNEGPGILNWIIQGWKNYQLEGLDLATVPELQDARDRYRDDNDTVKDFLDECREPGPESILSLDLYEAFKRWFQRGHGSKVSVLGHKQFNKRLIDRGFTARHGMKGTKWENFGKIKGGNTNERQYEHPF